MVRKWYSCYFKTELNFKQEISQIQNIILKDLHNSLAGRFENFTKREETCLDNEKRVFLIKWTKILKSKLNLFMSLIKMFPVAELGNVLDFSTSLVFHILQLLI